MGICISIIDPEPTQSSYVDRYHDATYENTPEYTLDGMKTVVKVLRILDGDTVDIALYHNASATVFRHRVRLYGIDTPEKRPPKDQPNRDAEIAASARSTAALRSRLEAIQYKPFAVFHKADKYGRLMCTFYESNEQQQSINDWMVAEGHAYAYFGKTKKKFGEVEQPPPGEATAPSKRRKKQYIADDEKDDMDDTEEESDD